MYPGCIRYVTGVRYRAALHGSGSGLSSNPMGVLSRSGRTIWQCMRFHQTSDSSTAFVPIRLRASRYDQPPSSYRRRWPTVVGVSVASIVASAGIDQVVPRVWKNNPITAGVIAGQHRQALAEWAPIMLATDELAPVLNVVAELNEKLFILQDRIRALLNPTYDAQFGHSLARSGSNRSEVSSAAPDSDEVAAVIASWRDVVEEAVSIQEELMRATGLAGWEHARGRAELGPWVQGFASRHPPGSRVRITRRRVQKLVGKLRRARS